jgi:hypothetical protein
LTVSPANSYPDLPLSGREYGYFPAVATFSALDNKKEEGRTEVAREISRILDFCIRTSLKKAFEMATG